MTIGAGNELRKETETHPFGIQSFVGLSNLLNLQILLGTPMEWPSVAITIVGVVPLSTSNHETPFDEMVSKVRWLESPALPDSRGISTFDLRSHLVL